MAEIRKTSGSGGARGVTNMAQYRGQRAAPVKRVRSSGSAGVSPRAREIAFASKVAAGAPDVRAERIQDLQSQIERGAYQPDPREIAQKLLERGI